MAYSIKVLHCRDYSCGVDYIIFTVRDDPDGFYKTKTEAYNSVIRVGCQRIYECESIYLRIIRRQIKELYKSLFK